MSISINPNPAMTKYLVDTGAFRDDPVTIVDVGARWGFNAEWKVFGDSFKVYCFEPDEDECARLNAQAGHNVRYIPAALGKEAGEATLYEARLSASTGLYKTNMDYFSRLLNRDNGEVAKEHRIRVTTLDEALARFGVPSIDFIKLDAEGAELDVLQGGGRHTLGTNLIGILSEFRFQQEINGSPVFSDLDAHVRQLGFRLFDMHYSHQSRRALPYPGLADYRLPTGEKFYAYTTHGQIMDGDALYFRDLLIPANQRIAASAGPAHILKTAALFEIYCLNDCAAELILASRDKLRGQVDSGDLLDLLVPALEGRNTGYHAYLKKYFEPGPAVVGEAQASTAPQTKTSGLKNFLRTALPPWLKDLLRPLLRR
jgi:FkbM family methyltransferase